MTERERLDKLLLSRGLSETRSQAQGLILAGKVRVNGQVMDKTGCLLDPETAQLTVEAPLPYVSRGGLKLEKALRDFGLSPEGRVCLDVGASTGGFTDCLLQHGATQVFAVDVGYGQLDWRLRSDPRVVSLEKTNIRQLSPEQLTAAPSFATVDVSFISIQKVLPLLPPLLAATGQGLDIIALLKPQFEYRDTHQDKHFKGVVRGEDAHRRVITHVLEGLSHQMPTDWVLAGLSFSPITGPKGNMEFLMHWRPQAAPLPQGDAVERVLAEAYGYFNALQSPDPCS